MEASRRRIRQGPRDLCGVCTAHTHVYGVDAPTGKYIRGPSSFVKQPLGHDVLNGFQTKFGSESTARTNVCARALTRREDRATPLSITPRATKQIKRMNTRGYSGAFPTGGMQLVEYLQPEKYSFVRSGLSDRLGQESIALSICTSQPQPRD